MSEPSLQQFHRACGGNGPLILDVEELGGAHEEQRILYQPFVLIGRRPNADLFLDHWHVSRRHAYLQLVEGRIFCLDLESRTGTVWEHGPERSGWVDPPQAIQIGPYRIQPRLIGRAWGGHILEDRDPATPVSKRYAERHSLPDATIEIWNVDLKPVVWPVARVLVLIGQADDCHVRIKGLQVSKYHCTLLRTRSGLWLVDLLTPEGVFINGERQRFACLKPGDEVRIGRFVICVRSVAPTPPTPEAPPAPSAGSNARSDPLAVPLVPWEPAAPLVPAENVPAWSAPVTSAGSTPEMPTPSGQPAHVESVLQPLLNHFGAMQQQMFDQFQQMMGMMAQMFGTMHRDHMSAVRDELEQIRRLTEEVHNLRAQLERQAVPPKTTPASQPDLAGRSPLNGDEPRVPSAEPKLPLPSPAADPSALPNGFDPALARDRTEGQDIHSLISSRLATLEAERQSRWRKILRVLKGP